MGKKWGMKTAWAKSFFVLQEQLDADGPAAAAAWRCTRCGDVLHAPTDARTRRPSCIILAEHLEGAASSGAAPITGVAACRAGVIRHAAGAAPDPGVGGEEDAKALAALRRLLCGEAADGNVSGGGGEAPVRVFVAVENPKTPANVGSILRAVGCFGFSGLIFSGSRLHEALRHRPVTDTQAAGFSSPYVVIPDILSLFDVVEDATAFEAVVVAVDMIDGATLLPLYHHPHLRAAEAVAAQPGERRLPKVVIYLFGAEDGTIGQAALARCHAAVFLPTQGSLNLAAAVNVVLYDRCAAEWRLRASAGDAAASAAAARDAAVCCLRTRNANNRTSWRDPAPAAAAALPAQPEGHKRSREKELR
ncbi:23S rRNA methyltransferase [Trypanosoma conorhini]|uniref:23S rRNA methyltransferase n=1 Tax=Trypanosoma conorhini TaxID=83891 RepID=A0A3R7N5Q5_9TRYP|nr:23S rRNA methyltransferase [Trypanosoma conorhini]RNF25833.1 23S rRNA methyltransferase [Trypanosoma conorhini]